MNTYWLIFSFVTSMIFLLSLFLVKKLFKLEFLFPRLDDKGINVIENLGIMFFLGLIGLLNPEETIERNEFELSFD